MHTSLLLVVLSLTAVEPTTADPVDQVAKHYLKALSNPKDKTGKSYLLGGVTLDAKNAVAYDAKILSRAQPRTEHGSVDQINAKLHELDVAGRSVLGDETAAATNPADLTLEQALALVNKTRQLRKAFMDQFPVFADTIRADKPLLWHPRNPVRALLSEVEKGSDYDLTYVAFSVSSKEVRGGEDHTWPLRVVRLKAGKIDSGWKVLPASDWDPE